MIRIGFAGAGYIADIHAGVLSTQGDVRIAAVCDADASRAEAFAAKHGGEPARSFEQLIRSVDAVYICTPNALHAELAIASLEAGRDVFSEKPMATSPADAERVRAAADRSNGVYQIGFNKRFAPIYRALKERIEAGNLAPRWANIKMNRGELSQPSWVADASLTGGFLYETPIHILDLACWLFGPVREVICRARQVAANHLDDFAMLLTFESGLTATLCASAHTTWLFPFERLEVYGEHGIAVSEEMERITFQLGLDAKPEVNDVSERPMPERWGYQAADLAFLAAVRGEEQTAAGALEGKQAVDLVAACYRAAESGQPVRLEEIAAGPG